MLLNNTLQILAIVDVFFLGNIEKTKYSTKKNCCSQSPKTKFEKNIIHILPRFIYIGIFFFYLYTTV